MPMVSGSEVCKFCLRTTSENNGGVALKQHFRRTYVRSGIVSGTNEIYVGEKTLARFKRDILWRTRAPLISERETEYIYKQYECKIQLRRAQCAMHVDYN